jgi:serine/threonine protein kinase
MLGYCRFLFLKNVDIQTQVTIIGVCSEASALVYEWLPNGNLEDCTLLFLHANKPSALVHGDLRPCNILIDANYRSKLCNFGMSNLFLGPGAFPSNFTVRLPCIDPEFLTTGELTPQSDTYSLGVIFLRLLTGMSPLSIAKKVVSAGDWPYTQAKHLAVLGLSCLEMTLEKRPDRLTKVWKVIEPMVTRPLVAYFQSASGGSSAPAHFFPIRMGINSAGTLLDGLGQIVVTEKLFSTPWKEIPFPCTVQCFFPFLRILHRVLNRFKCIYEVVNCIFQEIMKDPQVASDGFTYESEAIRQWLDRGNSRSLMTNLALPNRDTIPNHALRSCIQEYLEFQRQLGQNVDP